MAVTPTLEDFVKEYRGNYISWASTPLASSDIKKPSDDKIASGWSIEQPPHSYFNWHMNRTDERLKKLEAKFAYYEQYGFNS